jgi:hypothetical protein
MAVRAQANQLLGSMFVGIVPRDDVSMIKRERLAAHSAAVAGLSQNLSLHMSWNSWPARLSTHYSSSFMPNAQARRLESLVGRHETV